MDKTSVRACMEICQARIRSLEESREEAEIEGWSWPLDYGITQLESVSFEMSKLLH